MNVKHNVKKVAATLLLGMVVLSGTLPVLAHTNNDGNQGGIRLVQKESHEGLPGRRVGGGTRLYAHNLPDRGAPTATAGGGSRFAFPKDEQLIAHTKCRFVKCDPKTPVPVTNPNQPVLA